MLKRLGRHIFALLHSVECTPLFGPPALGGLIGLCPTQKRTARKTTKFCKLNNNCVVYKQHDCCFSNYNFYFLLIFNEIQYYYLFSTILSNYQAIHNHNAITITQYNCLENRHLTKLTATKNLNQMITILI